MHNAERVLFQAAGRICSHNLAQLQEAQATTVIGGGVDQACRAIATAVERTAHRGMLRAGRARVSDPWRAWPRIGSAPAREWRKLAAGREQQSGHRGGRICLRSSRPSCRAGASVSWRRTGPRERASLLVAQGVGVEKEHNKNLSSPPCRLTPVWAPGAGGERVQLSIETLLWLL
jgi:hypothetical protein